MASYWDHSFYPSRLSLQFWSKVSHVKLIVSPQMMLSWSWNFLPMTLRTRKQIHFKWYIPLGHTPCQCCYRCWDRQNHPPPTPAGCPKDTYILISRKRNKLLPLSVDGICASLLASRTHQRWSDLTPVSMLHYLRWCLKTAVWFALAGLGETNTHDGKFMEKATRSSHTHPNQFSNTSRAAENSTQF